ncbi:tRNA (adenosine(37)-N6)-threonylcarbamoyltransferase complex ATPase subunit type 1 TsaE [Spiractinospora alimapuensis]|uniref:tRNA (adenosine(37)-N6)-threonylcarbamoyltransferase complex ATPase subunit type 1 TsaE n=1 Tax=Spiractinospora alimapuensis TaxID=2820884 RepID=UPI001EEA45D7|nr:tRNA (adenosine(37)-N6)-threonylcarbamoyltransferase complex ATPase subunit type 1 TsaE [Spiractinospora alimapuensis]QVQ55038.1 tRNA (adenosine(37)-N6)-threonylcarbamoyltransferase complex ATPase subunit type 1 TsaE [Spiractinospora alimapuensis]
MRDLGRELAERLRPGDVVVLSGPLGAGKTTLTQGIGSGLGVRGPITSPTFALSRRHPSLVDGPALVHVDAYRLGDPDELEDLDLDATMPDSVTIVEWGEGVADHLGSERLEVGIVRHSDDTRTVTLTGVGARWADTPATQER